MAEGDYNGLASIATRSGQKLIEVGLPGSFIPVGISEYNKKTYQQCIHESSDRNLKRLNQTGKQNEEEKNILLVGRDSVEPWLFPRAQRPQI